MKPAAGMRGFPIHVSRESAAQPSSGEAAALSKKRAIASHELFGGARELTIVHQQDKYLLRITRQGKLILTK